MDVMTRRETYIAEMLDAVASLQEDDRVMTIAEAKALWDTANRNAPRSPFGHYPHVNPQRDMDDGSSASVLSLRW